jgi:hypothetical protein
MCSVRMWIEDRPCRGECRVDAVSDAVDLLSKDFDISNEITVVLLQLRNKIDGYESR